MTVLHVINLRGGGGDIACSECLAETIAHYQANQAVVSVAPIDSPGEQCSGCGRHQGARTDG